MTHPTIGPLFGNFKFQADVFTCPIRLYNAMLHNNTLNIGLDMSKVKLPKAEFYVRNKGDKEGKASLAEYLGVKAEPWYETSEVQTYNIIPFLAYYDVFKNYYANKQEERFYIMGGSLIQNATTIETTDFNGSIVLYSNSTLKCTSPATVTMFATIHICAYRRDYSEKENPSGTGTYAARSWSGLGNGFVVYFLLT